MPSVPCCRALVFGAPALRGAHVMEFFRKFGGMRPPLKLVRQITQNPQEIWTQCFR